MEDDLHIKLKRIDDYLNDIKDLFLFPNEWNEAYENNYVKLPHSYENYNLIFQEYVEKYMEIQKQTKTPLQYKNILTDIMFITLSPKNDTTVKTLYDKQTKFLKSTHVKDFLWVMEQAGRSTDEAGKNIHLHMLIKHTYKKYSKLKDHLKRLYGDVCGTESAYNIKSCKNVTDVSNRITYMIGDKEGEDKQGKQKIDKIWREQWNILDYYGNINIG